jgi:hypothetical protein
VEVELHAFLTSYYENVSDKLKAPRTLFPGHKKWFPFISGCVEYTDLLETVVKEFIPTSRYEIRSSVVK